MLKTDAPLPVARSLVVTGIVIMSALSGAIVLWAHYGAAVFFETIRAGFVACFG